MNELTFYLLKMMAGSGVMYAGYRWWLGNNQMVGMIRWYLLASLVIPALLPLISIQGTQGLANLPVVRVAVLPEAEVNAHGSGAGISPVSFSVSTVVYAVVCSVLFLTFVVRILNIIRLIRRSETIRYSRLRLRLSLLNLSPFSFFNNILISDARARQGKLRPIIIHEAAHIGQGHSYDVIFVELMCMLQWFNPFVWLFRKAIHQNHEFLADRAVVKQHCNPAGYKALLLESLTGISIPVVNNFNHSSLKKRFIMLNKPVSGRGAYARTLATVFVLLTIVSAAILMVQKETFALVPGSLSGISQTEAVLSPGSTAGQNLLPGEGSVPDTVSGKEVFTVVEEMPEFPGGQDEMAAYLAKNVTYPEAALAKGIEGAVFVVYIVEKDGSVSNVRVKRGFEKSCDQAALSAVKGMPRWKPGMQRGKAVRVEMVVPVKFKLNDGKKTKAGQSATSASDGNATFVVVEDMPQFPGGEKAQTEYLAKNIRYPEGAKKAGKEGVVYVLFVVETDGSISGAKVLRGFDKECDEAALQVIKDMPKWKPGTQRGKKVRVQFNLPVRFNLDKEKDKNQGNGK